MTKILNWKWDSRLRWWHVTAPGISCYVCETQGLWRTTKRDRERGFNIELSTRSEDPALEWVCHWDRDSSTLIVGDAEGNDLGSQYIWGSLGGVLDKLDKQKFYLRAA